MLKNKKVLVTGGLGFIGSHTVVELYNSGYEPVIIDNLSTTHIEVLDNIESIVGKRPQFEQIDLKDKKQVTMFFDDNTDIEGIIHFAAYKAVGESVAHPLSYYHNNVNTLVYLLQEMTQRGLDNFIFSSSCTVYGQADKLPITEDAPVKPAESPYGNTKQIGEQIIKDITHIAPLNAIVLRYFNPIGAHRSAKIGELPLGVPQNLVPFITQTAIGQRKCLSVFGNDYPTTDGTCIRDYIYVVDLAKAHVMALERLFLNKNNSKCEVFNLGTGKGNSVVEVITAFEKATGQKLNWKYAPRRAGDVISVYADTSYANEELGWKAEKDIEYSLQTAWQWQKNITK